MLSLEHLVLVDELAGHILSAKAATAIDTERMALEVIRREGREDWWRYYVQDLKEDPRGAFQFITCSSNKLWMTQ